MLSIKYDRMRSAGVDTHSRRRLGTLLLLSLIRRRIRAWVLGPHMKPGDSGKEREAKDGTTNSFRYSKTLHL